MKRLFQLLWNNNFTLLFLFLWFFSLYLVFLNNRFQQVYVVNSSNNVAAFVLESMHEVSEYLSLKETNASLSRENAELRGKLASNFYTLSVRDSLVSDSAFIQQYTYTTARVVNSTINRRNNYLTLDKGSQQGIKPDMGVISSDGVVGIVKQHSDRPAKRGDLGLVQACPPVPFGKGIGVVIAQLLGVRNLPAGALGLPLA